MNIESDNQVVVIGDIMLDINYVGHATRLAQEACIPVVNIKETNITYSLGGAANVYNNLLSMNINAQLISVAGKDKYYDIIREKLEFSGKHNIIINDTNRCTTLKHRFYVNNKIVFRYDTEDTYDINENVEDIIIDFFTTKCHKCKLVVLSDYNKGVLTPRVTQEIIKFSNKHNIKVFVDPKIKNITKYSGCFLIKPNKTEGEQICGKIITNDTLSDRAIEICRITNSNICLLTLGEDGMILYDSCDGRNYIVHTTHCNVIDITGAGDVVLAGFIYYYLKTKCLIEATKFSNYCGQLKVRNFGTYILTPFDVIIYEKMTNKLILSEDLSRTIQIIKDANKKIVFTNGCYDILHYGHLTFLEEAKALGDILIVALNTDESIKENKGDNRPINKLEYRIKQMCAIGCVDFVVVFGDKTPYELLEKIRPFALVKGGDYVIDSVIGKEFAQKTIILKYNDGFSTTNIIKQIERNTTPTM